MTAVIYARYPSDNQREESIEGQIRECTAYAEKNGITMRWMLPWRRGQNWIISSTMTHWAILI